MRLSEILDRLKLAKLILQFSHSLRQINGTDFLQIFGVNNIHQTMDILEPTGMFETTIAHYKNSLAVDIRTDDLTLEPKVGNKLIQILQQLATVIELLVPALEAVVHKGHENSATIKLPVLHLGELAKSAKDFDTITNVLLHPDIGGNVIIQNVENGSITFDVAVGTAQALLVLGGDCQGGIIHMHPSASSRTFSRTNERSSG